MLKIILNRGMIIKSKEGRIHMINCIFRTDDITICYTKKATIIDKIK